MQNYVKEFLNNYGYSPDTAAAVTDTLTKILSQENGEDALYRLVSDYKSGNPFREICRKIASTADAFRVDEYTLYLTCFILFSEQLIDNYRHNGISEEVLSSTLADLKYKTEECLLVKGKYGIFVPEWFEWHFTMKLFGMERLQFQLSTAPRDVEIGGKIFKKGSDAIFVHIPRSGKRLDHDAVLRDYKRAHDFFFTLLGKSVDLFCCHSWLLFPLNRTLLPAESNIARFCSDYEILDVNYYHDYSETWRLFDREWRGDVSELPADTTLRRKYIKVIKSDEKLGDALGAFIYDDLKI